MPILDAITFTLLVAVLHGLQSRRQTFRCPRLFRGRRGLHFRGAFRQPFFHPRHRNRHRRHAIFNGHRGGRSFAERRGRRMNNRRHGRGNRHQDHGGRLDLGMFRRLGGDPGAGPSRCNAAPEEDRWCPIHGVTRHRWSPIVADAPPPPRLPTPTSTVKPHMVFGTPVVAARAPFLRSEAGPSRAAAAVSSFTAVATTFAAMPATWPRGTALPLFSTDAAAPVAVDVKDAARGSEEEDPEEEPPIDALMNLTLSSSQSAPPLERPTTGQLALPRTQAQSTPPRSPDFNIIIGAEPAGSMATGPSTATATTSPHTPNGGPLLWRFTHLAGTPPRRPGREAGAWSATARREVHLNGVVEDYDDISSSSDEEEARRR
ncbi:hypothetical protein PR202_ga00449 [Eleusine coracana subsp. coracana]|uniref:Uncharacterized protein n=1 Tax=Eleusine coracana subsp. coracana TaxID=191504 RepID=A0AAV5BCQ4_ELECO|nr:hypothetical protein PR202_ga00449 [Eleusine coracana subsp. coracana]